MQNSGLTNAISPLTSLTYPFKIPVLGFVSLRGEPGLHDEPQHELMGEITEKMLDLMQIKWGVLSPIGHVARKQVQKATDIIERKETFFFVVKKGTFTSEKLNNDLWEKSENKKKTRKTAIDEMPSRYETLRTINQFKDENTIQLATTGKTGRELYEIEDAVNNFYMVGSMGCVSSLGLGLAYTRKDKDVIIIDGDGSMLMRMGSLATNGYYQPKNMLHILLDNLSHDSTGGQRTVSNNVNFVEITAACGYENSYYVHSLEELQAKIVEWKKTKGLTFLYLKIFPGSKKSWTPQDNPI